ncbi:MAG: 4-hydroxy-tetrahydrodipicolinate reductase [Thermodesulfobacteriota bacterium]
MAAVKISVAGAGGRMGGAVISEAVRTDGVEIAGLFEMAGHKAAGTEIEGVRVSESVADASAQANVVVDFTSPRATLANARYCAGAGRAMVIGTTGFTPAQREELEELSGGFACVMAPNMSIGVNVLERLVSDAAAKLGDGFDIEVLEIHHAGKADAPSGTALALARAAAAAGGRSLESAAVCSREGTGLARGEKEIGIQSLRGGAVAGDHTVFFLSGGERLELSHRASDRGIFAAGAIRAAKWVCGKPAGMYGMKEVLGL